MKRLALLLGLCILQYFAFGQKNLYVSNGISSFARWPIVEAGNSVFYLSYTNDTVNGRLINRHFISSVNKFTNALQHSVQLLADTVFSPYEYQSFPISYSFNPSSNRLNIFFVTDEDSSSWAPSTLKQFPKSIY